MGIRHDYVSLRLNVLNIHFGSELIDFLLEMPVCKFHCAVAEYEVGDLLACSTKLASHRLEIFVFDFQLCNFLGSFCFGFLQVLLRLRDQLLDSLLPSSTLAS